MSQALPMNDALRIAIYEEQRPFASFTPAQVRRLNKKASGYEAKMARRKAAEQ